MDELVMQCMTQSRKKIFIIWSVGWNSPRKRCSFFYPSMDLAKLALNASWFMPRESEYSEFSNARNGVHVNNVALSIVRLLIDSQDSPNNVITSIRVDKILLECCCTFSAQRNLYGFIVIKICRFESLICNSNGPRCGNKTLEKSYFFVRNSTIYIKITTKLYISFHLRFRANVFISFVPFYSWARMVHKWKKKRNGRAHT